MARLEGEPEGNLDYLERTLGEEQIRLLSRRRSRARRGRTRRPQ
jgi:hypothetical protein